MKKKILIFIPSIEDGGVEKNLFIVSNYLNTNGFSVEILTCNFDKSKKFNNGIKFIGNKNNFWQKKIENSNTSFVSRSFFLIFCLEKTNR